MYDAILAGANLQIRDFLIKWSLRLHGLAEPNNGCSVCISIFYLVLPMLFQIYQTENMSKRIRNLLGLAHGLGDLEITTENFRITNPKERELINPKQQLEQ